MRVDFDPSHLTLARATEPQVLPPLGASGVEGASATPSGMSPAQAKKLREAQESARDFEQMFAEFMLKSMRSTAVPEDESNAMDVYKGLLDTEYAKAMTGGGGLGIQDLVLNWMKESDPTLRGLPLNAGQGISNGTNSTAPNRALQQLQLQQYQVQAMLPLLKE